MKCGLWYRPAIRLKAENLLNNELRLKMARMVAEDYNGMKVSDIEFHMPLLLHH